MTKLSIQKKEINCVEKYMLKDVLQNEARKVQY